MSFKSTQILRRAIRQNVLISSVNNRSFYPVSISVRPFTTDKNASKSDKTGDAEDAAGFDIFEQLKAKNSGKSSSRFNDAPEMDPKEEEKLKREAEKAEKEVKDRQKKTFRTSTLVIGIASLGAYLYLGFESDEESNKNPDESALEAHNRRAWNSLMGYIEDWRNPSTKKLLPGHLPEGYQRPLTICVSLNDSLVHLVWDKSDGWKAALRPGAKKFLASLSRYYEVVIFTKQAAFLAEPVVSAIDPFQYAMYRLYKDHTHEVGGKLVKDIENLNRDPKTVILLDINPDSYSLQPENALSLKPWKGEAGDRELIKMGDFLIELNLLMSMTKAGDVRPFLRNIKNIDSEDFVGAWQQYKEKLRIDFDSIQKDKKSSASVFGSFFEGKGRKRNVIDMLEAVVREEKIAIEKDQEHTLAQMREIQKQQQEAIKKQLEENKKNNLKLADYIRGAGQPENQNQSEKQPANQSWFSSFFPDSKPQSQLPENAEASK